MFWVMPNTKIETIGDFFEKVVTPVAVPFSILISAGLGIKKYKNMKKSKKGKSP